MDTDAIMAVFRQATFITALMIVVVVMPGLLVGLFISILQAATQINESSLSFIPKLLATFFVAMVTGPWLMTILLDFTREILMDLPTFMR